MNFDPSFFKKFYEPDGRENFLFWSSLAALPTPTPPVDCRQGRVLIFKPDSIGDFVLFAPLLAGLRSRHPNETFFFFGMKEVCELARSTGLIDEVIEWDRHEYEKRQGYWRDTLNMLHKFQVDTIFYPCVSRESNADEMIAVIPAPEKIAPRSDDCNINKKTARYNERFYSRILKTLPPGTHEYLQMQYMADQLLISQRPVSFTSDQNAEKVQKVLEEAHVTFPYIIIAPGSRQSFKCWRPSRFAAILNWYLQNTQASIVLAGGPGEEKIAEKLINGTTDPDRTHNLTGKFSLPETTALISRASLFVGNDSGLAHLAASYSIPGHVIMGGGHYGRFFPRQDSPLLRVHTKMMDCFGCNWNCTRDSAECIIQARIPTEDLQQDCRFLSHGRMADYQLCNA